MNKLREAEVLLSQGATIGEASRKIGVTEQTYYRWRKEYGGMRLEQAKRLKELEKENSRLKKLVTDISLDNAILKEAARGKKTSCFGGFYLYLRVKIASKLIKIPGN
jgi:transposase-like protein